MKDLQSWRFVLLWVWLMVIASAPDTAALSMLMQSLH